MNDKIRLYHQDQPSIIALNALSPEQIFNNLDISESTKSDYLSYIDKFIRYVRRIGFDNNILLQYKKYLKNNVQIAVSTKNKYLTVAKIYLKELHRLGYLSKDFTVNVKNFKQDKKHKRVGLTHNEISQLINNLTDTDDYRLRAILALLALQGLRQIEIVRLDVNDIDLDQKTMMVSGKSRDDKELIDLHPHSIDALKNYLEHTKKKSGALFTSDSNNSLNRRLTTRSIRRIVKNFLILNNVNKVVHGFRHYFTTILIEKLDDLLIVQEFTRHKSLEMLQIYNDRLRKTDQLPMYYNAFETINFS